MSTIRKNNGVLFLVFLLLNLPLVHGQIEITTGPEVTAMDLAQKIVGEGIQVLNAEYIGADSAKGIFSNGDTSFLGKSEGIILCSGFAEDFAGPNNSSMTYGIHGLPGDASLNSLGFVSTFDAAILEFDFIPESNIIQINFVFGSEEYPMDTPNQVPYNDIMGVFLSGPKPLGGNYDGENIAIVPNSAPESFISVFSINDEYNNEYYIDNLDGQSLEYDGFTIVLSAFAEVISCEEYQLKIAVADASDMIKDSGVTLEANSITIPKIEIETISSNPELSENMVEGCVEMDVVFRLPNASYSPATVNFENVSGPGYAINGSDYGDLNWNPIDPWVTFEEGQDSVSIHIISFMDGYLEGDELIQFIIENTLGCEIRYDTVTMIINDGLLSGTYPSTADICPGEEVLLQANVYHGIPPYEYFWTPGNFMSDSIIVFPDSTTTYTLSVTDQCEIPQLSSKTVNVLPDSITELSSFVFEADNNFGLGEDIIGEFSGDTILLDIDGCINPFMFVATFISPYCASVYVNDVEQISGVSENDFTFPVIYKVLANNGDEKDWIVIVDFGTGLKELSNDDIHVFPNPAKNQLNIHNAKGFKVSLFLNLGVNIFSEKILNEKHILNIKNLKPGIYYLKFEEEEKWFVRRFIIEN